jgi:predicted nucleic acid-binding protein
VYVLDCSVTAALFLPDEKSAAVTKTFAGIAEGEDIFVPQLWWYEMSNVLSLAVKRGWLKHAEVIAIIRLLKDYGFDTDVNYGEKYAERLFELSQRYELSAYDATYLELAIRKNAKLATLDDKLGKACEKAGIGSAVE